MNSLKFGNTTFRFSVFIALAAIMITLFFTVPESFADIADNVSADIRTDGVLYEGHEKVSYTASISDCTKLTSIQDSAGDIHHTLSPSEATRISGSSTGCECRFEGTGQGRLTPEVVLNFNDGSGKTLAEQFQI